MPQDQETLEKELRRQMREGRAPLIQAVRASLITAERKFIAQPMGYRKKIKYVFSNPTTLV